MSLSINNNASALVALETLNQTQESLDSAQNAVATGKRVSSAADNPASYGISAQINNDVSGQSAVNDGLSYASQLVTTSLNAADSIVSTLNDVRNAVTDFTNKIGDKSSRDAITAKLTGLAGTINTIARNATVKGTNLLSMSTGDGYGIQTGNLSYLTGAQGDMQTISGGYALLQNNDSLSSGGMPSSVHILTDALGLTTSASAGENGTIGLDLANLITKASLGTMNSADANKLIDKISAAITSMTNMTSTLGSNKNTLAAMSSYGKNLQDSLTNASSSLVDADMAAESAKLTALQTKQSLGVKALTIANGQSQNILSLFQ
ncbi:flagellin [Acetobacteraceae bacterium ESL0709]|nr:flagellin [Acetobacteraceae bacterium ESL0697]MDF7679046.1 flagellin [Acetobacteraceae bacterium ESL0709]